MVAVASTQPFSIEFEINVVFIIYDLFFYYKGRNIEPLTSTTASNVDSYNYSEYTCICP